MEELMELEDRIRRLYAEFNARDIDAVLAQMTADVDWPNAREGGRLSGREAVRAYWLRQWEEIDGRVEPTSFEPRTDGSLAVGVHQVVRNLDGDLLSEQHLHHVYAFRDGLITAMTVEEKRRGCSGARCRVSNRLRRAR